jgi:hypothetical protein
VKRRWKRHPRRTDLIHSRPGLHREQRVGRRPNGIGVQKPNEGGVFPTPDRRGHFAVDTPSGRDIRAGLFMLSTRRGKQFNSMVWKERRDPISGVPDYNAVVEVIPIA